MKLLRVSSTMLMFAIVSCNQKTSDDYKQVFSDRKERCVENAVDLSTGLSKNKHKNIRNE